MSKHRRVDASTCAHYYTDGRTRTRAHARSRAHNARTRIHARTHTCARSLTYKRARMRARIAKYTATSREPRALANAHASACVLSLSHLHPPPHPSASPSVSPSPSPFSRSFSSPLFLPPVRHLPPSLHPSIHPSQPLPLSLSPSLARHRRVAAVGEAVELGRRERTRPAANEAARQREAQG
eukprot:6206422-Pleurochrysis_carterae.AAC.3